MVKSYLALSYKVMQSVPALRPSDVMVGTSEERSVRYREKVEERMSVLFVLEGGVISSLFVLEGRYLITICIVQGPNLITICIKRAHCKLYLCSSASEVPLLSLLLLLVKWSWPLVECTGVSVLYNLGEEIYQNSIIEFVIL